MEDLKLKLAEPTTVASQVYKLLFDKIVSLELAPGSTIVAKDIAAIMGISITPVREAFLSLSKEGLLNIYPQKGTAVSKISIRKALEERFIRETIEKAVLEDFIEIGDTKAIDSMQECIDGQRFALEHKKYDDILKADTRFHHILYEATDNELAKEIIDRYSTNDNRMRMTDVENSPNANIENIKQHEQIVKYIKAKNADKAKDILGLHLEKVMYDLKNIVAAKPEYFIDIDEFDDIEKTHRYKMMTKKGK